MRIFIGILIVFSYNHLLSQQVKPEFGDISTQEIKMESFNDEPDAEAVILFDYGKSIFIEDDRTGSYDILFTRHKRLKILKNRGKDHAEVTISYYVDGYGRTEEIRNIKASTFNILDGKQIRKDLNKELIHEGTFNEKVHFIRFTFPDVQEGSILDLEYELFTPFLVNLPDWTFQDEIPTRYSQYDVSMIPFFDYVFISNGIRTFDVKNSVIEKKKRTWGNVAKVAGNNVGSGVEFQEITYTFGMKDVPSFKEEPYMPNIDDYIMKMDFQLEEIHYPSGGDKKFISTWEQLGEDLLEEEAFGKYMKSSRKYAKEILDEEPQIMNADLVDRIRLIVTYIKENFQWNNKYRYHAELSAKDFQRLKIGSSAEINLLLLTLLKEAGLEAYPVLLSTRDHGKIPLDYPFLHFFNNVIVQIGLEKPLLVDGTEDLLAYNMIPPNCVNEMGLVLLDKTIGWVYLNQGSAHANYVIQQNFDDELNLHANFNSQSNGYFAYNLREKYHNDTLKMLEHWQKYNIQNPRNILSFNYEKYTKPYVLNFEYDIPVEIILDQIVFKPFSGLKFDGFDLVEKERKYPIDFIFRKSINLELNINIPPGYSLYKKQFPVHLENEAVQFDYQLDLNDQILNIKLKIQSKSSIYLPQEYPQLKKVFDRFIETLNQELVLVSNENSE